MPNFCFINDTTRIFYSKLLLQFIQINFRFYLRSSKASSRMLRFFQFLLRKLSWISTTDKFIDIECWVQCLCDKFRCLHGQCVTRGLQWTWLSIVYLRPDATFGATLAVLKWFILFQFFILSIKIYLFINPKS